ncbi:hypothetical protein [Sphingomonas sp. CFBP 13733]|uniref:hypothetical protein n=1 Tax=Sphingomonas sp. CFBP 13733 TaxID=2775291 RepID=UPI00177D8FF8|nr:hypothetical protein [Sphingomonas sp. CFBP 13733]MBD8640259.1 hypothetical protein [Sphingomonas sp. CFBP 13733]
MLKSKTDGGVARDRPKGRHARARRLAPRTGRITASGSKEAPDRRQARGEALARPKRGRSTLSRLAPAPRLFTATIAYADGSVMMQAFHASVADHPGQVVQRLRTRFGDEVLDVAELRLGFHPGVPLAVALVPTAIADMIRETERNPSRPAALSFVVDIEQRIQI